jgi:hypothetical protein
MSKLLITNVAWVAVAAGAFFFGKSMVRPGESGATKLGNGPEASGGNRAISTGTRFEDTESGKKAGECQVWLKNFRGGDGKISADQIGEAIGEILRQSDQVKASLYFAQLLEELTPENAPAAFKALRERAAGFDSMRYQPLLAYAWGQKDGKVALASMDEMGGGREVGFWKASAMSGWAAQDPDAAIAYREAAKAKNPGEEGEQRRGGRMGGEDIMDRGIVSGLARRSVDEALQYVGKLDENRRGEMVGVITEQKLKEGVTSAAAWAGTLTDTNSRKQALETVGNQYARQDLKGAAAWAASISNDPTAADAVDQVAERYSRENLKDSYTWAQTLHGTGKVEAYKEVFESWGREDSHAASVELAKLAAGAEKDGAIESFSRTLAREAPEDAMTWASSIGDAETRQEAQIDVAQRWYRQNKEAATAWMNSNLAPEAQKQVTNPDREWGWGDGRPFGRGR